MYDFLLTFPLCVPLQDSGSWAVSLRLGAEVQDFLLLRETFGDPGVSPALPPPQRMSLEAGCVWGLCPH